MKIKKYFIKALCLLLVASSIPVAANGLKASADETAASSQTESAEPQDESTPADGEGSQDENKSEKHTGTIKEIDTENSQITITSMAGGAADNGGQPPEMPSGDGNGAQGDGEEPPEKPDGEGGNSDSAEPPEKPDGESGDSDSAEPPAKPDGENDSSDNAEQVSSESGDSAEQPPEMPGDSGDMQMGETEYVTLNITDKTVITDKDGNEITIADLKEDDFVEYTYEGDELLTLAVSEGMQAGGGAQGGGMGNPGGGNSSAPTEFQAVTHYTEDAEETSGEQSSTGTDENIAWVSDGATVSLSGITADKTSSDSTGGDNSSFYGVGAAYLVTEGTLNISDSTITTDSAGGAGVFAYGDGVANVSDTTITTQQGTSGGIHVAGGGTLNASNLTVETNGASSAAIRSDRGSGTMTVDGGTYTSNGTGSPAVYSTADITVSNATLTATNSEAVCIEGKNSLKLTDCDVSSNMPDNDQNDCKWSVILYQSMSGDSEVGNSTYEMTGGSLTSTSGGLFYTTNTASSFTLDSVEINADDADFFLKCTGNSNARGWGSTGENGADCTFTAINQQMNGDIIWDSISTLDLQITEGSCLTGAILDDETNAGNGGDGYANVTIDADSSWIVTGDSTVTSLTNSGTIQDADGNTVTIKEADGNVLVEGTSTYSITVSNYTLGVSGNNQ